MNKELIINDEIYGDIYLDGVYKDIVESDDFQRLKDIVQTGKAYFQYPEMKNENRFEHSIGSYYLMCKIIKNIEEKLELQGISINEEEKEIAKIAMLLHDIGHGAYSHTLEKVTGYSHEKRSIDIVKSKDTQINQILRKYYGEDFTNKVSKFLERVYEHENDKPLSDIKIHKKRVNLEELLASLISNNIDADRLDYIVRDSKKADFQILTQPSKLIESFEFVLDVDKIIVAIPEEKKILLDMTILERARNYKEIYFCSPSIIGDKVFEILLEELRKHPKEVPEDINNVIKTFLTNSKASFSTKDYMKITETPMSEAIEKIKNETKNEKIKELCDMKKMSKTYQILNTEKKEEYIRYLLHKAIPEISENTNGVIEETRWIKPYKSNENENINIITCNGIEDYKDIKQDLINLEPFTKRTVAISEEMIRLELGITKEQYEEKYKDTVKEIIDTATKAKDEFELRYVLTRNILDAQQIKEKIEEKYEIIDGAEYMSNDIYYDDKETYDMLENKKALRIRRGTTFHNSKETYNFKKVRATYKTYKKDKQTNYTIRRKEEQIGDTDKLEDYQNFLDTLKIDKEKLEPVLEVDNLRHLYTVKVNGVLIDISFNIAHYQNKIYEMFGNIGTIEIKPRENKVQDRLSMLEFRQFLEENFKELSKYLSNTNVYEIGMLDTYEKYRKGYILSENAKEYEMKHKNAAKKLKKISDKAKQSKDFMWLNEIPNVDKIKNKKEIIYKGEEI